MMSVFWTQQIDVLVKSFIFYRVPSSYHRGKIPRRPSNLNFGKMHPTWWYRSFLMEGGKWVRSSSSCDILDLVLRMINFFAILRISLQWHFVSVRDEVCLTYLWKLALNYFVICWKLPWSVSNFLATADSFCFNHVATLALRNWNLRKEWEKGKKEK